MLFVSTPQSVFAQSTDDVYRQTLQQLILVLQQQILELQIQLENQQDSSIDTLLGDIDGTLVASYTVESMEISGRAPQLHRQYLDRLAEIFPDAYDEYVTELVIFDSTSDTDAYVETVFPYDRSWRYGVSVEILDDPPQSEASTELIVHEFAHVFSLDQVFIDEDVHQECHTYFDAEVCWSDTTYLGKFLDTFWSEESLDALSDTRSDPSAESVLYERDPESFVSDYAATDPAEDFAESFAWYVYDWHPEDGGVAADKIDFFDRFSFIKELKKEIVAEL
jgi:hypothetical protein